MRTVHASIQNTEHSFKLFRTGAQLYNLKQERRMEFEFVLFICKGIQLQRRKGNLAATVSAVSLNVVVIGVSKFKYSGS